MSAQISLGTVQFGSDYGISNKLGQPSDKEVKKILERAYELGVRNIDTAALYGSSEHVLGKYDLSKWYVTTKISINPAQFNLGKILEKKVEESLKRLNINQLDCLLLHDSSLLLNEDNKNIIIENFASMKCKGLTKNIGISIYDIDILDKIKNNLKYFDTIQSPLNILDQRIMISGWIERLSKLKINLQIRSIFLQGLLLMNYSDQINKFPDWSHLWKSWHNWLQENNITPLEACINFAKSVNGVNKVIIGINNQNQLDEIVKSYENESDICPTNFGTNDINLINPSLWN